MFGRKRKQEHLPWYRQRGYKGSLTEQEKRGLDALREQPAHPATSMDDLPDEVQGYINHLEFELQDKKEETLVFTGAAALSIGVVSCYSYFVGLPQPSIWTLTIGVSAFAFAMYVLVFALRRSQREFLPNRDPDAGEISSTDEAIRREWEVNYIVSSKRRDA